MAILGQITVNEISVAELDQSPLVDPISLPIGSLGIDTVTGIVYSKIGPLDSDWTELGSAGAVTRVGSTNDRRIAIWDGDDLDTIKNSKAEVQIGGAIQAQSFVGRKEIDDIVLIPSKHYVISSGITIMPTGSVTIDVDSELIII